MSAAHLLGGADLTVMEAALIFEGILIVAICNAL